MKCLLILAAFALAGCTTTAKVLAPIVDVSGPKFAPSQFQCGSRPPPPDPQKGTGKAAARYENALGVWGQGCANKLQSIGSALSGAGQVTGQP